MSANNLLTKLKNHHQAAQIAILLICCTVFFAIPEGISLLNLSTQESRSAVINTEGNILKIYKWQFSTHIRKTNHVYHFDKTYGLPDILILDPGEHLLDVTCRGRIFSIGWVNSDLEVKVEIEPNTVYKIVSKRASTNFGETNCSIELIEVEKYNSYQATDLQLEYLKEFGF